MKKFLSLIPLIGIFFGVASAQNPFEWDSSGNIKTPSGFTGIVSIPGITSINLPWVNVKDYGAKGDGVTDDTVVIRAAYVATPVGGFLVFPTPSVYYKVTSTIDVPTLNIDKAIKLIGIGSPGVRASRISASGVRIRNMGTGDVFYLHAIGEEADQIILENLRIEGNSSSRYGINIYATQQLILRDIYLGHPSDSAYGHGSHGLYIQGLTYYSRAYNLISARNGGDGVRIEGTGAADVNIFSFYEPWITTNAGNGLTTSYCQNINVYGGAIEGNTGYGALVSTNSLHGAFRDIWYEGNGNGNILYVDSGSASPGLIIDGGNFSTGGITFNTCIDASVRNSSIASLTINVGAYHLVAIGIPSSCTITDNSAGAAHPTIIYRNAQNYHILKLEGIKITGAGASPGTGTWGVGDIAFMVNPTAGQEMGWICTGAGTPGTWIPFYSVVGTPAAGNVIKWNAGGYAYWVAP